MTKNEATWIQKIWSRLTGTPFSSKELIFQIRHDGGHDISNLSDADILALLEGRFKDKWEEPAFTFSEMLAYYSVLGKTLGDRQAVGWLFCALVLSDTMDQGAVDIDGLFMNFIKGFLIVADRLNTSESLQIIHRFFCRCE